MVKTSALRKVLKKLKQGSSWLTIRGSPGEGKSTVAYMALEELHKNGREVLQVISPEEFSEVSMSSSRPVIMLDDIFGNLEFDQAEWSRWRSVLIEALKIKEHRSHEKEVHATEKANTEEGESTSQKEDITIILVGRDYVLNTASWDMGRIADYFSQDPYVVDMSHAVKREDEEKIAIWNAVSASSGIQLDKTTVEQMCHICVPHGFPHVCRLFVTVHKTNPAITAESFFQSPLIFLNQTLAKFMRDKHKRFLFKAMIKGGGKVSVDDLDDDTTDAAHDLVGTYLKEKDGIFAFDHPSIFDSVAVILCERDPVFVITMCDLTFIHERLRLQPLCDTHSDSLSVSGLVVYIPRSCIGDLAKRFAVEISKSNLLQVLSHQAFTDNLFIREVMSMPNLYLKRLLNLTDNRSGATFLSLVPSNKSPQLLMYLESQKDIKLNRRNINTVLYGVCKFAASDVLTYIVQTHQTIDINTAYGNKGKTPIMIAAETRNGQFLEHVLSLKPNLNTRDKTRLMKSVLHYLCENGLVLAAGQMIESGTDINVIDWWGRTPLSYACSSNHTNVVRLLLNKGAKIDDWAVSGGCMRGNVDVVKLLLDRGMSVNMKVCGDTPLNTACEGGHVKVISLLIEKGANINTPGTFSWSPLHTACDYNKPEAVQCLLDHGAEINIKDREGETPLHSASEWRRRECVDVLLKSGADVNVEDEDGQTPLHRAVYNKFLDHVRLPDISICQSLVQQGADVNKQDGEGNTPLHLVCRVDRRTTIHEDWPPGPASTYKDVYKAVVTLLLDRGTEVNIVNHSSEPALLGWCKELMREPKNCVFYYK